MYVCVYFACVCAFVYLCMFIYTVIYHKSPKHFPRIKPQSFAASQLKSTYLHTLQANTHTKAHLSTHLVKAQVGVRQETAGAVVMVEKLPHFLVNPALGLLWMGRGMGVYQVHAYRFGLSNAGDTNLFSLFVRLIEPLWFCERRFFHRNQCTQTCTNVIRTHGMLL